MQSTKTTKTETKKRTREVFPTAEVFHKWASQSQETGRNASRNVFFNKQTIYSYGYHFPIASFLDYKHSKRLLANYPNAVLFQTTPNVVLFTNRNYSVTTSKHISYCRRAINHCILVYCQNVEVMNTSGHEKHIANVKDLIAGITALCEQESKAVKHSYTGTINSQIRNLANYVALFQLKTLKPYISTSEHSEQFNERRIAEAKKLTKQLRFILSLENDQLAYAKILGLDLAKAQARITRKNERRQNEETERRNKEEKARLARLERDRLLVPLVVEHWRNGRSLHENIPYPADYPQSMVLQNRPINAGFSPYAVIHNLPTMLRVSRDGSKIETSRQATISIETARRIWPTLQAKANPGDVDGYRGVGFNHAQEFIIGCHRIPYCEIELMAIQLGLISEPSSECVNYNVAAMNGVEQ